MSHQAANEGALEDKILSHLRVTKGLHTQAELATVTGATIGGVSKTIRKLCDKGLVLEIRTAKEKRYQLPSPGITKFKERLNSHRELKEEIGERVFELLLGGSNHDETPEEAAKTRLYLWNLLPDEVRCALQSIHMRQERTVLIDGGTTNFYVANALRSVSFPSETYRLWQLLAVTNCPPIADCLYELPTGPGVALIGGRVSRDTSYISGYLAEQSIAKWDIMSDFSIIGSTGIVCFVASAVIRKRKRPSKRCYCAVRMSSV